MATVSGAVDLSQSPLHLEPGGSIESAPTNGPGHPNVAGRLAGEARDVDEPAARG